MDLWERRFTHEYTGGIAHYYGIARGRLGRKEYERLYIMGSDRRRTVQTSEKNNVMNGELVYAASSYSMLLCDISATTIGKPVISD